MTTTTLHGTDVTPCPVPWCHAAGHHQWEGDNMGLDPARIHKHLTLSEPTGFGRSIEVSAEVHESMEARTPSVELYDADSLYSREQMERVIAAMRAAADLAFGPTEGVSNPETPAELFPGGGKKHFRDATKMDVAGNDTHFKVNRDNADFDAALDELVQRAANPTDINRLVAAAIRLRNALRQLGLPDEDGVAVNQQRAGAGRMGGSA